MGWSILFIVWLLGAGTTFGLLAYGDLIQSPKIDGWFNLAAAIIWPTLVVGLLFDRVKRGL